MTGSLLLASSVDWSGSMLPGVEDREVRELVVERQEDGDLELDLESEVDKVLAAEIIILH